MFITSSRRPARTVEPAVVTFSGVTDADTDADIAYQAYLSVRESPTACFGHRVRRYGTDASVVIYRD